MLKASPPKTSRHALARQEINLFLRFLDSIRETLTDYEISHIVKLTFNNS